jgi:hypothetical protein
MNLAKEISFLLYKHNCVILPGFGAFLINEKAAEVSEVAKYALPKQEVITFNKQIINQDGLVANHLSQKLNTSYEQGVKRTEEYISGLWDILKTKRNVEVTEVGTFYYTQEDKLVFVPYHSVNFSKSSFGLPKLRLKQISDSPAVATIVAVNPNVVEETNKVDKIKQAPLVHTKSTEERKPVKRIEKKEKRVAKAQETKLKKKSQAKKVKKARISNLSIINVLGSVFLVAMVFALLNFEMNNPKATPSDVNLASIIDTHAFNFDSIDSETEVLIEEVKPPTSFGIYAQVNNEEAANSLVSELVGKYTGSEVSKDNEDQAEVFIISFSNEEFANEYKNLIQNKLDQKLVIKKK